MCFTCIKIFLIDKLVWTNFDSTFLSSLLAHNSVQIEILRTELHGFSDASSLAYGANIYLRTLYKSCLIEVNLICSKSQIAPIKIIDIQRLKLLGNLLLSRLMKISLKSRIKV